MPTPSPSTRDLARRLVTASRTASGDDVDGPGSVIERLGSSLSRFAGVEGFASLLRRALALAAAEVPPLTSVRIDKVGQLQDLGQLADGMDSGARSEAMVAVVAHLLELLVTFIGEPITLRLVREAWPEATSADHHSADKEKP